MKILKTMAFVFLAIGCAPKKNSIDTTSCKTTSLDAYSAGANEKNLIQSIINSDSSNQTMVELDKVKYKITQFNSIIDTLKGKYNVKIEKKESYQTIKIVRL
jgi:hypothetical protein